MSTRPNITVTGADERTNLRELSMLNAEIGFLFTTTPEGRNRYPALPWIQNTAGRVRWASLHVCGRGAREMLFGGDMWLVPFDRIQINGVITREDVEWVCAMYPEKTILTQHTVANADLLFVRATNHGILIDASGGRGLSPAEWTAPFTSKVVGFAGGLGPDNLTDELRMISHVAKGGWWVDMEGKLRVDDWFSVERAAQCIAIVAAKGGAS